MQQVTPNVYAETKNRGCNAGFVTTSEGVVMIDAPADPVASMEWRDEIARRGEVRYLINTEPHMDHICGSYFHPGIVVAHQGTREAILKTSVDQLRERVKQIYSPGFSLPDAYHLRVPTVTFQDRLCLYVGNHTFELLHLPGHTASEIGVYIPEEKVLFTGDNIFHKVQAFLHEAHPVEWLDSLKRIEAMDVEAIVPGHGEVCDKSYISEQASFIREWMEAIKKAIGEGLSVEEAKDRISFLDRYPMDVGLDALGPEVQKWNVGRLYGLLSASK